jgi:hypothetical protein
MGISAFAENRSLNNRHAVFFGVPSRDAPWLTAFHQLPLLVLVFVIPSMELRWVVFRRQRKSQVFHRDWPDIAVGDKFAVDSPPSKIREKVTKGWCSGLIK